MEWVETTGTSLDAAKERALDQLGVDETEAEFEVVAEAKAGIFGLGRADARVRARVKPRQPRAKSENRRRRSQGNRRGGRGGKDTRRSGGEAARDEGRSQNGKSQRRKSQGSTDQRDEASGRQDKRGKDRDDGAERGQERSSDGSRNRQKSSKGRSDGSSGNQGKRKESAVTEQMDVEEQSEVAIDFVQGLVDGFGMNGSAEVDVDGETLTVNVVGEELGLLVGPQGATLRSVEELTRTVLQRRADGRKYHRIRVDVGGYKQRRREALEAFTLDLAAKVKADGVSRALEPMAAPDRKIVHDTVIDVAGVDTVSEGDEPRRRVVLVPSPEE